MKISAPLLTIIVLSIAFLDGVAIISAILFIGAYAEILRRQAMAEFKADREFQNLFWVSLHNAPTGGQFFLHAGALKNGVPYAWSSRTMNM